jgi:hypothetical protein
MNDFDLTRHASFIGLIYDQTLSIREPICTFWQVDKDTIVTTAHSVILYKEALGALRARFPISGQERSLRSIAFHPELDVKQLSARAKVALTEPFPALPLQMYNVAVLKLSDKSNDVGSDTIGDVARTFAGMVGPKPGGLGGSLAEIELPLVVQTITNARKEGTLSVCDERGRTLGKIFCKDGRIHHVFYRGLVNEMAFYQIINHRLTGTFHFQTESEPDWTTVSEITKSTDLLLLESLRRLDEIEKLTAIVGGPSSLFERRTPAVNLEVLPPEAREFCRLLWPYVDGGTPLGSMWQVCGLDDFAVYSTLQELIKTRQVNYFEAPFVRDADKQPMELGLHIPLAPNDPVAALWVEDTSMAPLVRRGVLLGSARDQNPSHVVHNIALPTEAAGAPIFKDGGVIGLHCGSIPPDPLVQEQGGLHQMIWVEAVINCLRSAGDGELAKRLTMSGEDSQSVGGSARAPGIKEVVRIQCPKCGRSSLELANFCKGCGQRLIQDLEPKGKEKKKRTKASSTVQPIVQTLNVVPVENRRQPVGVAVAVSLLTLALGFGIAYAAPKPSFVPVVGLLLPELPRISTDMAEWIPDAAQPTWRIVENPNMQKFEGEEKFCIDIKVNSPSYVYAFCKQSSGALALMYPMKPENDQMQDKEASISVGTAEITDKSKPNFQAFTFDNRSGTERFILMASGQKAKFLSDTALFDEFSKRALDLLSADDYVDGVETTVDVLGQKFFDDPAKAKSRVGLGGLMGDSVYLKLIELSHEPKAAGK